MAPQRRKRLQIGTVTVEAVADLAGVSTATVSRALNEPAKVSAGTREAVLRAVSALQYVPHGAARALASRRSRTFGAVVPTLKNAIFAACLDELQRRINVDGFVLLVATSEYDAQREADEVSALLERGVDGIMLVGREHDRRVYERLRAQRVPFVLTWATDPRGEHPYVGFDNRQAAMRMVRYLLDLGHRRFAMIAGVTEGNDRAADRVAGVRSALAAAKIALRPPQCLEQPYTIAGGRAAMRALLRAPSPPTAVICGNDVLALGALDECRTQGVDVPARVSVCGFDDIEMASYVVPGLTTMRVLAPEIGMRAGDYLLSRVAGRAVLDQCDVDVELVVRGSTGPPPRRTRGEKQNPAVAGL